MKYCKCKHPRLMLDGETRHPEGKCYNCGEVINVEISVKPPENKKKLNMIEKGVANMILDFVLNKAVPSIIKDAQSLYDSNKSVLLTIQKRDAEDGTYTLMPMIIVYDSDKIFQEDSPLMDTSNIALHEGTDRKMIEPIDNAKRIASLIEKFM